MTSCKTYPAVENETNLLPVPNVPDPIHIAVEDVGDGLKISYEDGREMLLGILDTYETYHTLLQSMLLTNRYSRVNIESEILYCEQVIASVQKSLEEGGAIEN